MSTCPYNETKEERRGWEEKKLTFPENNVPVPYARDDLLDNMLTEEAFGIGHGSNLEGVERDERLGGILPLTVAVVVVFVEDGQARDGLHELVALVAAVVGDGRFRRVDRVGPGLGEQGGVLVDLVGRAPAAILLVRGGPLAVSLVGDLVEAVVDDLALGKVGEEAPSDDLGGIGTRLVDALILGGRAVVPLEGPCGCQHPRIFVMRGANLQQGIDNSRVAARPAKMVHQAMQTCAG